MVVDAFNFDDPVILVLISENLEFEAFFHDLGICEYALVTVFNIGPLVYELSIEQDSNNVDPDLFFYDQSMLHSVHEECIQVHLVVLFLNELCLRARRGWNIELELSSTQLIGKTTIYP